MRTMKLLLISMLLVGVLAGCGTVNGAGHDISSAGHVISNSAQEASR
ncbi:MAG: entericidin A/B family lipoprotein [Legionellales bacterium]|nr:entericidin A/B family lipoprotein [Legionellales bacterium]